jgi:hypothetical protein
VRARLVVLVLVVASACGGKVVVDGTSGSGGGAAACGANGLPVPSTYKACKSDSDCTIRFVPLDQCGTPAVVGVAILETATFASYEKRCDPFMNGGSCDPGPAVTDDGQVVMGDLAAVHVTCAGGLCETSAP